MKPTILFGQLSAFVAFFFAESGGVSVTARLPLREKCMGAVDFFFDECGQRFLRRARQVSERLIGKDFVMTRRRPLFISLLGLSLALPGCGDAGKTSTNSATPAAETDCSDGTDNDGDGAADCEDLDCRVAGAKTCELAPKLDRTVPTTVWEAAQFLFTGKDPLQKETSKKAFNKKRIAILRGKVVARSGEGLAGVRVSIGAHKEWGYTVSRPDGLFDIAVEGGSQLLVQFSRDGYLAAERGVRAAWQSYEAVPEIGMIEEGKAVTAVGSNSDHEQVAEGDVVEDKFGRRQAIVVFPKDTGATAKLPDGSTQELGELHVRLADYPLELPSADNVDEPSRFAPGTSPHAGSLSWGVEATIDEAQKLGATTVQFSAPVAILVENFLKLPVGSPIPLGYYERGKGHWQGETAGVVIQVVGVTDGEADIDADGDGEAEDDGTLKKLNIFHGTRRELARRYEVGTTVWHIAVEHFSPQSADFPSVASRTAQAPAVSTPLVRPIDEPTRRGPLLVERQALAQAFELGLAGTPYSLRYQSDRTTEFRHGFRMDFPVIGAEVPDGLKQVVVKVRVAGQPITQTFAPAPNLHAVIDWDGKDGFGRVVQGQQRARVTLSYIYDGQLRPAETFGATSRLKVSTNTASDGTVSVDAALSRRFSLTVGAWDASGYELGGLGLDVLHAFDPATGKIYFGWGDDRSAENVALVTTRPAGDFPLGTPDGVFAAPDGSVIVTEDDEKRGDLGALLRIAADGTVTPIVGDGAAGDAADLVVGSPQGVAMRSDGSILFADYYLDAIREIALDGSVRTLVGRPDDEQGTPEIEATLDKLDGIALGLREELYIINGDQVLKLEGGALTPFAGTGDKPTDNDVLKGEGAPADAVPLNVPSGVAVGPDGSVFISERDGARVRQVTPDGIMRTIAGTGVPGFSGDGQRAAAAQLHDPRGLALAADGSLYIADQVNNRIRRVTPDGFIQTVVGGGDAKLADGQLPTKIKLDKPDGIAFGSDGALYVATGTTVYKVAPGITELANTNDSLVPSEDGHTLFRFDARGKHTETINAVTGVTELSFGYDDAGLLTSIKDKNGLTTTIKRDDDGVPGTFVGPFGQRTNIEIVDNVLKSITDPLDRTVHLEYSDDGLLSKVVSPLGAERLFEYDKERQGLLRKVTDPSGYFEEYKPGKLPPGVNADLGNTALTVTTPSGDQTKYTTTQDGEGIHRLIEALDGGTTKSTDAVTSIPAQAVDGTRWLFQFDADTGLGSQVLVPTLRSLTTPGGRTLETVLQEAKKFDDPKNLLSASEWQNAVLINGKASQTNYDRRDQTITSRTPMGRISTSVLDKDGRVIDETAPGLGSTHYDYDQFGRVTGVTRTAGKDTRTQTYGYDDSDGFLRQVTDALNQTTSYAPDLVGRLQSVTDPTGAAVAQTLDADNRLTLLTLPGGKDHQFSYDDKANRLLQLVTPPAVQGGKKAGLAIGNVRYKYNNEKQPTLIEHADGNSLAFTYDSLKRVQTLETSGVALNYTYDRAGRPLHIARSDGAILDVEYDGQLLTSTTWSGPVKGKVTADYDADLRLSQLTVNDASTASFEYDDDGAVISATGNKQTLSLVRDPNSGLVTETTLGSVTTNQTYNGFGELETLTAHFQGKDRFTQTITRDALGRIAQLDEVAAADTTSTLYTYDGAGRLETVTRGKDVTTYQYDENGNRTAILLNGNETAAATYDAQDRIISHGEFTYEQTQHGDLLRRTGPNGALELSYDGLGNLLTADVTSAKTTKAISYTMDGQGRRVGKQIAGKFSRAWLYRDQLRPVAEITDIGIFTHFIYADAKSGAPDFMLRAGVPFRLIKDHLGSVRFVVNATTGVVAQILAYDEFGNVTMDTNLGFQPFGFAGGLYDADTSLVRFGARDYDSATGRWLGKDPIAFRGGQANLYVYAHSDPVNAIDPTGLTVYVCSRIAELKPTRAENEANGFRHWWIWNSEYGSEAGSGPDPSGWGGIWGGLFSSTRISDHRGAHAEVSWKDVECTPMPYVDEACSDQMINASQYGKSLGPWVPFVNDCQDFAWSVINRCDLDYARGTNLQCTFDGTDACGAP